MDKFEIQRDGFSPDCIPGKNPRSLLTPCGYLFSLLLHLSFLAICLNFTVSPNATREVVFVELVEAGVVPDVARGDSETTTKLPEAAVPPSVPPTQSTPVEPVTVPPPKMLPKIPPKPQAPATKKALRPVAKVESLQQAPEKSGAAPSNDDNISQADAAQPSYASVTAPIGTGSTKGNKNAGNQGNAYSSLLMARLNSFKEYPLMARRRGMEGQVVVRLVIQRDGSLQSSSMTRSSGFRELDESALRLVQRAAPYPPVPDTLAGMVFEFLLPITYALH